MNEVQNFRWNFYKQFEITLFQLASLQINNYMSTKFAMSLISVACS
jgi:hypothetical protein